MWCFSSVDGEGTRLEGSWNEDDNECTMVLSDGYNYPPTHAASDSMRSVKVAMKATIEDAEKKGHAGVIVE